MPFQVTVTAARVQRQFTRFFGLVRRGHTLLILLDGKPVARMVPIKRRGLAPLREVRASAWARRRRARQRR